MKRYHKFFQFINRLVYLASAAMMMAGLVLTVTPQLAEAQNPDHIAICHVEGNGSHHVIYPDNNGWNGHENHKDDWWIDTPEQLIECQTPTCPPNSTWDGQACVCNPGYYDPPGGPNGCEPIPTCPPNSSWNGSSCVCNSGYDWDNRTQSCVSVCPPNSSWNGSTCICDSGYYDPEGGGFSCEPIPQCPANSSWDGSSCICDSGYVDDPAGGGCVLFTCQDSNAHVIDNPSSPPPYTCACNTGFELIGGVCTFICTFPEVTNPGNTGCNCAAGYVRDVSGACVTACEWNPAIPASDILCVPPYDACLNIEGIQTEVPTGLIRDKFGNCVDIADICVVPGYSLIQIPTTELAAYLLEYLTHFQVIDGVPPCQCPDQDADGVCDDTDNCLSIPNPNQENGDSDQYGDACDVCPEITDDQTDTDGDGVGDACEVFGCPNKGATNYNPIATEDNSTCIYPLANAVQCVYNNGDGSMDVVFSYHNYAPNSVDVPIGGNNTLTGSYDGGLPPTSFNIGETLNAFSGSTLISDPVSWVLTGPDGISSTAIANLEYPVCPNDPLGGPTPVILLSPYCTTALDATTMDWTINNPNAGAFTVDSWTLDGIPQSAPFAADPGISFLVRTDLSTHTIELKWGLTGQATLTSSIASCPTTPPGITTTTTTAEVPPAVQIVRVIRAAQVAPLPVPVTGGLETQQLIPVTGANLYGGMNGFMSGGLMLLGIGMVLTGLRRKFNF